MPELRDDGWWFTWHGDDYGPYRTKAEANDDRVGLDRTARHHAKECLVCGGSEVRDAA